MKSMIMNTSDLSRKPQDVSVIARKLGNDDYADVQASWFADNKVLSTLVNVFSIYIPRGEKFFIKSVRYFEDEIKDRDDELSGLVKEFIKQEANHYKAHEAFNGSLSQHDVSAKREEKVSDRLFSFMEKFLPKKVQLGITVFDEHLTATGAKLLLKSEAMSSSMDPEMRKLWEWHAVEEIEHKSVAYDVYEAMGCGYFHRMFSAFIGVAIQLPFIVGSENRLLKERGVTRFGPEGKEAGRIMASFHDFRKVGKEFLLYFKPGFHPWDIDDRPFLEKWYRENAS